MEPRQKDLVEHSDGGNVTFMEKLLGYFESEAATIDAQFTGGSEEVSDDTGFTSCIRFNGQPILPPLMTEEKRVEMQMYRHQAIMAETRIRARARQKLLERVQNVMDSIDEKHGNKRGVEAGQSTDNFTNKTDSESEKDELKLSLDNLKNRDDIEEESHMVHRLPPKAFADDVNKNNTTQSPRTDSGICSRIATSAEMTDALDDNLTIQEPLLDTMAEITDISSGSDNEDEKDPKSEVTPKTVETGTTNEHAVDQLKNRVVKEPKGMEFLEAQPRNVKDCKEELLRVSAKSTSSSTTLSSNEENKTVISKEDSASYYTADCLDTPTASQTLLETLPETDGVSPRVDTETQTDLRKASDFEDVQTTNKVTSKMPKTFESTIEEGTLLSKVDIGAFSDLSDEETVNNHNDNSFCDSEKVRPKSAQSLKSPTMLKDVEDIKFLPSPTPSCTPDVSRISAPEEGTAGHNESMRSEALRASMDFESDEGKDMQQDNLSSDDTGEPPKCSTRISQIASVQVDDSATNIIASAISPAQLSNSPCPETSSKSSDTFTGQTCSTDLGRYMAHSQDTLISSSTTLPYSQDTSDPDIVPVVDDLTPVPEQDEDLGSTQKSDFLALSIEDKQDAEDIYPDDTTERLRHVRRGSYTLSQPSPALVKSQCTADEVRSSTENQAIQDSGDDNEVLTVRRKCYEKSGESKQNKNGANYDSEHNTEFKSFNLTSSMEDLKLKAVPRKLEFSQGQPERQNELEKSNVTSVLNNSSEKQGKEEHLARYLENLSQVPGMKLNKRKVRPLNTESKEPILSSTAKQSSWKEIYEAQENLERESNNPQRLSAKFTEQILNGMQTKNFDNDSLASMSYHQDQENISNIRSSAVSASHHSMGEDFLKTQLEYFETLRQQLITQQQEQLRTLVVEQQKQQMLFQQEILRQSQSLLLSMQSGSFPISTHQSLTNSIYNEQMQPSQSHSEVSLHSQYETQTVPQDFHPPQVSQNPFYLNSNEFPQVSAEEQALAQFFSGSYHPSMMSEDFSPNIGHNHSKKSSRKQKKGKSHPNPSQRVSFSIDSDHPASRNSRNYNTERASEDTTIRVNASLNHSDEELDISVVAGVQVPQFPGDVSHTSPRYYPNGTPTATAQSTPKSALKKYAASPGGSPQLRASAPTEYPNIPYDLQRKFDKVSAVAKGYLTRRLLKTDKVQHIIQTIKDTAEFALGFQQETPIKKGQFTVQDRHLLERVLSQLTAAMYEIHEIFFEFSIPERMAIIAQSRQQEREKFFKQQAQEHKDRRVSSATQKAMERRKQAKAAEAAVFGDMRPNSAPAQSSSPRCDGHNDLSGHIRRNYAHLMAKAMKPMQSQYGPVKPAKEIFNKAVAKEHSAMLRHTNVAKRNVANKNVSSRPVYKPKKTIGSPVSKSSPTGTKPAMKRVIAPVRPKSTAPAWK